ncbi:MAG: hypothetical protein KJ915_09740 [Candidatus Omnitrophica bacterium]|nr:hypothetical protein [Candidatus Omnitrophota bacterium]
MSKIKFLLDRNIQKKTTREKAQAMVVAFIYISIVSLIAVYMMAYANNLHNVVVRNIKHSMSFYAAEGALIRVMSLLSLGQATPAAMNTAPMTVGIDIVVVGTNQKIRATVNW